MECPDCGHEVEDTYEHSIIHNAWEVTQANSQGTWEPIRGDDYSWYTDLQLWNLAKLAVDAYERGRPYAVCMDVLLDLPQDRGPVRMAVLLIEAERRRNNERISF